jgi:maleylpyruvate isomerase
VDVSAYPRLLEAEAAALALPAFARAAPQNQPDFEA